MSRVRSSGRFLLLCMLGVGCGKSTGGAGGGASANGEVSTAGGTGSATVTYQPNVHVLERKQGLDALLGTSSDGWTLLFDGARAPELQALKKDDVLLVKGLLARKVIEVEVLDGSRVAVLTQSASIGETVQNGHVELKVPIRFGGRSARLDRPARRTVWDFLEGTAHAQSAEQSRVNKAEEQGAADARQQIVTGVKKAVFEGWESTWSATVENGRVDLDLVLKKQVGGFLALIKAKGYLQNFDIDSLMDVQGGVVEQLKLAHKNLNGAMDVSWEVGKDTPGVETGKAQIKLPAAISIPLYQYLDGFPLFLEISGAVLIEPAISGGKEYSKGSFHITYDGYQGFEISKGGGPSASGSINGDIQMGDLTNVSPTAPMGIVVSLAAPRIELSFGVAKVLKFDDMKEAADKVDKVADELLKKTLGDDGYARWKASPMGGFSMSKAVDAALKSDAAAYVEVVSSTGMSHTGMSSIVPCSRTDIHLLAKVGASAEALGQSLGQTESEIFKKDFSRIEPPGTRPCESK